MDTPDPGPPDTPDPPSLVAVLAAAVKHSVQPHATEIGTPDELANDPNSPELTTFVGFLGGSVTQPRGGSWRLLYLDWRLLNWLLVEGKNIVHSDQIRDRRVPSGRMDVIWVRADTPVRMGRGSHSVESRFLTGSFTQAGDFDAPLAGGTAASTGVYCEARTPLCCHRTSRC